MGSNCSQSEEPGNSRYVPRVTETGFASSGKAKIYYEASGEGRPVVYIHAGIADSRMWQPQFDDPPEGFRVVRLDLRGFGNTRLPKERYTDCEDTLAVMNEVGIEEAILVGCSMGAEVALDIAALAPYRLTGLALIGADAPGFDAPSSDVPSPQWPEVIEAYEAGDLSRVAELDAEIWVVGRDRSDDDVDPEVLRLVEEMDLLALRSEERRDDYRKPVKLSALPHIDVPTLIVVGEHDQAKVIEAAEHLGEVIEDARLVMIDDAAHLPSLERPEAFKAQFRALFNG